MKFSAFDHIERWEGLRLKAYKDIAGVWTIGYGHTGKWARPGAVITEAQAQDILDKDLDVFEAGVLSSVKVPLNQNQFDALVSLAFNIGVSAFKKSTVLRRLNEGDYQGAADAILMWNKVTKGGKKVFVQGLANRRQSERELFLTPVPSIKVPTQLELFHAAKIVEIEKLVEKFKADLMKIVRS